MDKAHEILHLIAQLIEVTGVLIIALGGLATLAAFIIKGLKDKEWQCHLEGFRKYFGKAILLGLEFLVAADIVGTITVKPDLDSLYALGLVVLIRTFLSFSLSVEIEGKLPWRKTPQPR